ncbi:MAG: hypothetical protein ACXVEM_05180 [Gaiellaceae bacterium]
MPRRPGRLRLIALGAALAYFFDPANGTERRKAVVKKLASLRNASASPEAPELNEDLAAAARK